MCCEACPKYEECAANDELKDKCCQRCPDHDKCFAKDEREYEKDEEYEE